MEYSHSFCSVGSAQFLAWMYGGRDIRDLSPYLAIGVGDEAWDTTPVPVSTDITALTGEIIRIQPQQWSSLDATMFDLGKILYSATDTEMFRFVGELDGHSLSPYKESGLYIREYGLFVNASSDAGSGLLVATVRHSRWWWSANMFLRREIILDVRG